MNSDFLLADFKDYAARLIAALEKQDWQPASMVASELARAWREGRQVFICGNGGSAANALHWANDFLYIVAQAGGKGVRISALPANTSLMTCLANDLGYDQVFASQLATHGRDGDVLVVLSGSGNSPNVVRAIEESKKLKMKSIAIVGYSGGACKTLADQAVHFQVNDMQIAEDMQLILGHMLLRALQSACASEKV